MLAEDACNAPEKYDHGRSAEKYHTGVGTPAAWLPRSFPNTSVKTIIKTIGLMTAHAAPMTVCL